MAELTNEIINKLGKDYYARHPIEEKTSNNKFSQLSHSVATFFKKSMHNNHGLAKKLIDYQDDSTEQEKWLFLLSIYAELPNDSGEMASTIEKLTLTRFDLPAITRSLGYGNHVVLLTPKDIARTLVAMVNSYFALPLIQRATANNISSLTLTPGALSP